VKSFDIKIATTLENMAVQTGVPKGAIEGFIFPKLDLTSDAEYVTNLVNVNV